MFVALAIASGAAGAGTGAGAGSDSDSGSEGSGGGGGRKKGKAPKKDVVVLSAFDSKGRVVASLAGDSRSAKIAAAMADRELDTAVVTRYAARGAPILFCGAQIAGWAPLVPCCVISLWTVPMDTQPAMTRKGRLASSWPRKRRGTQRRPSSGTWPRPLHWRRSWPARRASAGEMRMTPGGGVAPARAWVLACVLPLCFGNVWMYV